MPRIGRRSGALPVIGPALLGLADDQFVKGLGGGVPRQGVPEPGWSGPRCEDRALPRARQPRRTWVRTPVGHGAEVAHAMVID